MFFRLIFLCFALLLFMGCCSNDVICPPVNAATNRGIVHSVFYGQDTNVNARVEYYMTGWDDYNNIWLLPVPIGPDGYFLPRQWQCQRQGITYTSNGTIGITAVADNGPTGPVEHWQNLNVISWMLDGPFALAVSTLNVGFTNCDMVCRTNGGDLVTGMAYDTLTGGIIDIDTLNGSSWSLGSNTFFGISNPYSIAKDRQLINQYGLVYGGNTSTGTIVYGGRNSQNLSGPVTSFITNTNLLKLLVDRDNNLWTFTMDSRLTPGNTVLYINQLSNTQDLLEQSWANIVQGQSEIILTNTFDPNFVGINFNGCWNYLDNTGHIIVFGEITTGAIKDMYILYTRREESGWSNWMVIRQWQYDTVIPDDFWAYVKQGEGAYPHIGVDEYSELFVYYAEALVNPPGSPFRDLTYVYLPFNDPGNVDYAHPMLGPWPFVNNIDGNDFDIDFLISIDNDPV